MLRLRSAALLAGVLFLASCQIEDRTPTGSRRDDDAIRAVLATYYRALGERDLAGSRAMFWDSASVELRSVLPDTAWRDFRSADAYHTFLRHAYAGDRTSLIAVRMFRIDVRQQGDVASAWIITRRRPLHGEGRAEVGTADNLVLRRSASGWRIVSLVSVPDNSASAR